MRGDVPEPGRNPWSDGAGVAAQFHECAGEWEALQQALAALDVLQAFCMLAATAEGPMCRPQFVPQGASGRPFSGVWAKRGKVKPVEKSSLGCEVSRWCMYASPVLAHARVRERGCRGHSPPPADGRAPLGRLRCS